MVALAPVSAITTKMQNGVQKKKMSATDDRVKYIKEVLTILRMVKQFGWESQVKEQIDAKRDQELYWVFRGQILRLISIAVNYLIPLVHIVVTFALYTLVQKQPLTASIVFSALTGFSMLREAMFTLMFMIPALIQANVSIGRVQDFLNDTELLDSYTADHVIQDASDQHQEDIGLAQASFFWSREHGTASDGMLTPSRQKFRLHIEDEVIFKKGAINLIVGPTGSGKTSLLMALLGEMHYVPSGPGGWVNIPKKDGVAYCAQEAWIQSLSINENILFGAPYDEARYKKVIYQCGLKRDLTLFDAGDLTEIGEKGLTLS
jgi:ABC-type multidrug transport system fused ATPase/permease subunit